MKGLADAEHILGMQIKSDRQQYTLHLSKEKYIEKVLDRFNVANTVRKAVNGSSGTIVRTK